MRERQLLRDRAAQGEADQVGAVDLRRVQDGDRVLGELAGAVGTGGRLALADSACIGCYTTYTSSEMRQLR